MRLSVRHETLYRYNMPVRLGPHLLRLTPRAAAGRLEAFALSVDPAPAVRCEDADRFGNPITHIEFKGLTDRLRIESRFVIDTAPAAPLDDPGLPVLPWPAEGGPGEFGGGDGQDDTVRRFAEEVAAEAGWAALPFLERLTEALFTRVERRIRLEGAAQAPARTLANGRGACRDLTRLFAAACRCLGMPARFVSGYQARAATPDGRRHLHAWPEVFLPGLGWRGFDPTHGVAVGDGHIALCVGPDQAATMPLDGSFFGQGVKTTLDYRIDIARPDDGQP